VKSTGIYCRPVCPARQPLTRNVSFWPSAAAAEAAGFRPCLRCRPETAPFSPAWRGSAATVSRALRLIDKGILDREPVDALADRLGISSRHLDRLFRRHAQATPLQVARTCRLQRAKRLLDTTNLSVTEIAFAAGFSSLRRFNAVFRDAYGRPPSSLPRLRASPRRARPQAIVFAR